MKAPRRLPPCLAAAPALPAPLVPLLGELALALAPTLSLALTLTQTLALTPRRSPPS